MNKLVVICGPTATGKTSLGIKLAKKFDGQIVSADSRQVYKGMDIGTGKDLPLNTKYPAKRDPAPRDKILNTRYKDYRLGYYLFDKIPVWLLDIVTPDFKFSVADYAKCADLVIKDIWKRGKLPILVGGTGFYIKGVIDGIETMGVEPDPKLRKKLRSYTMAELQSVLERTCPERLRRMNKSDRRNPRRLMRAIEIALQFLISPAKLDPAPRDNFQFPNKFQIENTLSIGLTAPNKILYERIDRRVDERMKQGITKEIKGLLAKGYSWENSALGQTIGYKEWREYFMKTLKHKNIKTGLREEIIQKWKYNEHGYARRQLTWFRKDKRIQWVDITEKGWENKVTKLAQEWV